MWRALLLVPAAVVVMGASCLPSQQTSVILRNDTSFVVNVELFFDDDQDIPEALLVEDGSRLTFSLSPGTTQSFSRPCEDLQAIIINDADMVIAPGISPEASSRVYREPDDFTCGNTLTFTFTQGGIVGQDLEISFAQQQ